MQNFTIATIAKIVINDGTSVHIKDSTKADRVISGGIKITEAH